MNEVRKHIEKSGGRVLLPVFAQKHDMLDYIGEHQADIMAEKLSCFKMADAFGIRGMDHGYSTKASKLDPAALTSLQVKAIINATNLFDSHGDVHIPGIWKKGLKENPPKLHLQEHKMEFQYEISRNIKAYTETTTFKALGYPRYKGDTEVLVFDSNISKSVNEYMFAKYATNQVDNHSVGMRYVKIFFAVNSDSSSWKEEKDVWDKYYPMIANQKDVDQYGYFWAVTEAKAMEGSAVLAGSCWTTPTQSVEGKTEQPNGTQINTDEPLKSTQRKFIMI